MEALANYIWWAVARAELWHLLGDRAVVLTVGAVRHRGVSTEVTCEVVSEGPT